MGAFIKISFCVTLSVLILQLETANGEWYDWLNPARMVRGKKNRVIGSDQLNKHLDKLEEAITSDVNKNIAEALEYVKNTQNQIKQFQDVQTVRKVLKSSLKLARKDILDSRADYRKKICGQVEQFKKSVEKGVSHDADLAKLAKTPEFETKLHAGDTMQDESFYDKLNYGDEVNKQFRHRDEHQPRNSLLADWKKYYAVKDNETLKTYRAELEGLKEISKKALDTLRNGISVWEDKKEALRNGEKQPQSADEKAAVVGAALSLEDKLDCSFD